MKPLLSIVLSLSFALAALGQTKDYAGMYSELKHGIVYIYPETDTTFLFYIECSKGPPSYNSGSTTGRARLIKKDSAIYSQQNKDEDCILTFKFCGNKIRVGESENIEEHRFGCGYGNGVSADGIYIKRNSKIPKYFIDRHGDTTYFSKIHF